MRDGEQVLLTLGGDADAYGRLISKYSGSMYRLAYSLCGRADIAEETVQEAFTDGYLCLRSLEKPDAYGGWLAQIVRRKCYRCITRRKSCADIEELGELTDRDELTPPELILRDEKQRRVRDAVEALPPACRDAARLFYLDGLDVRETASRLGIPEGTVKSRLYDAREKLRKELWDMNENMAPSADFEKKIRQRITELSHYYVLYSQKPGGFESELTETLRMIGTLGDERKKQFYSAEVYKYAVWFAEKSDKDGYEQRKREAAEAGANAEIIADDLISRAIGINDNRKTLEFIDNTALPALDAYTGADNIGTARGKLIFWRGYARVGLNDLDGAADDFNEAARLITPSDIYQAVAVAAARLLGLAKKNSAFPGTGLRAVSEKILKDGDRLLFVAQPGFSYNLLLNSRHRFDSLFFFTSRCRRTLLDTSMKPGESICEDGASLTCVSDCESVATPAGEFEGCRHIRVTASHRNLGDYIAEAWYRDGVGLIKATFESDRGAERYLLSEYTIKGGTGPLPFAEGNRWVYINPELPSWLYTRYESRVEYTDESSANISAVALVTVRRNYMELAAELDSEACLTVADSVCDAWKLEDAISLLRAAVRANSSSDAVQCALAGIDTLSRFADYQRRGYRFCPSSVSGSYLTVKGDRTEYDEQGYISFGPYRFGTRGAENRIFGNKLLRYLQKLTGCVWDKNWAAGYSAELPTGYPDTAAQLTVEDGGVVITPAGSFERCLKLTLSAEVPYRGDRYYFKDNYSYTWCGKKEYWFAPGVGIVRHVCTWGDRLASEALLTGYSVPAAASDEYMPVHIGSHWEYDETNLSAEGYRAKKIMKVASGIGGKYLLTEQQEFIYLGTEEQYESFKAALKAKKDN